MTAETEAQKCKAVVWFMTLHGSTTSRLLQFTKLRFPFYLVVKDKRGKIPVDHIVRLWLQIGNLLLMTCV